MKLEVISFKSDKIDGEKMDAQGWFWIWKGGGTRVWGNKLLPYAGHEYFRQCRHRFKEADDARRWSGEDDVLLREMKLSEENQIRAKPDKHNVHYAGKQLKVQFSREVFQEDCKV